MTSSIFARPRRFATNALDLLVPVLHSWRVSKMIEKTMQSLEGKENEEKGLEYMKDYSSLTTDEVQCFYQKSLDQMKSLEDKAKISVLGVTVAVSLVTGIASLLSTFNDTALKSTAFEICIVFFGVISVAYMSMSGWAALLVLGDKNRVYQLFPSDMRLPDKDKLKKLALYTELNVNLNILRNNYVYAAYRSIVYAILSLSIMFVFITVGTYW
jgi:hypothetical protein